MIQNMFSQKTYTQA